MPNLTLRDYLSLLGLVLLIISAVLFFILRQRRVKQAKEGFVGFLVGRLLVRKTCENGIPDFASRSEALEYANVVFYEFRLRYAAANGYMFASNPPGTCEKLVDKLCEMEIIPKSVYGAWR